MAEKHVRPEPVDPEQAVLERQLREASEYRDMEARELKTLAECGSREYYLQCVVGIPTFGMVSTEFTQDIMNMASPINFTNHVLWIKGKPVAAARNEVVTYAIENGAKFIFFRDDDVLAPHNSLPQLAALIETKPFERNYVEDGENKTTEVSCDIVAGMYWSKQQPPHPLIFRDPGGGSYWEWELGEVVQCVAVGMGLTLIKTSVFEAMEPPWFETIKEQTPEGGRVGMTEDFYFCLKAIQAGFQVWCDAGLQAAHQSVKEQAIYGLDGVCRLPSRMDMRTGGVNYWPGLEQRKDIFRNRRGFGRRSGYIPNMERVRQAVEAYKQGSDGDGHNGSGHQVLPLRGQAADDAGDGGELRRSDNHGRAGHRRGAPQPLRQRRRGASGSRIRRSPQVLREERQHR